MKMSKLFYGILFIPGMVMAGGKHDNSYPVTSHSTTSSATANAASQATNSTTNNIRNTNSVSNMLHSSNSNSTSLTVEGDDVLPSMSVGNSVSTGTCYAGSNLGGGGGPVSIILPFVKEDKQCTYRQNIQIVQQLDQEGARKMLCLLDGYAEMTGDCAAEVVEKEQVKTYKPF